MRKIILLSLLLFSLSVKVVFAQVPVLWGMTSKGSAPAPVQGSIFNINGDGSNFVNYFNFYGQNGFEPLGNLSIANPNVLYGITTYGGKNGYNENEAGYGTIFEIDSIGAAPVILYNFDSINGKFPSGNLTIAANNLLYGMTALGGANNDGIIFSFDTSTNTFINLHDFAGIDGAIPNGSLIQANNGKLYGLTDSGGNFNLGVLFSYNPSTGAYIKLHDFDSTNGAFPKGSLIQALDGKLYGLTSAGGSNNAGVIFSIDTAGLIFTKLYDFASATGANPYGSLIQTMDSIFYGLTSTGGVNGAGVVFNFLTSTLNYTDLHDLDTLNGATPYGSLIQASDNNLYGTTCYGGTFSFGTVFSFNPGNNNYLKLHDFDYSDGAFPHGDLVQLSSVEVTTDANPLPVNTNKLSVYPNPSDGEITIVSAKLIDDLKVTNLLGQLVYESYPKQTEFTVELNNAGMYFITSTCDNQITAYKVIVIK